MRLVMTIALALPALAAGAAGQEPFPLGRRTGVQATPPHLSSTRRVLTLPEQLVLDRELHHARQRSERIEMRKWLGISTQRPSDHTGFGTTNLYQYRQPWEYGYHHPYWHAPTRIVHAP